MAVANDPDLVDGQKKTKAEQETLSSRIKSHHSRLRTELKAGRQNAETLWAAHLQDKTTLQQYSAAMHSLATGPWEKHGGGRIRWCVDCCTEYFTDGHLKKLLLKDLRRVQHAMPTIVEGGLLPPLPEGVEVLVGGWRGRAWRLLDVGSCYNPFAQWPEFEVTAVDIAPAVESVWKCDFLNVDIVASLAVDSQRTLPQNRTEEHCLKQLQAESFDVAVFSLLLSYLPCTQQRLQCCINAHRVLRPHGLLLVITPDSSHQNRHAGMMKSWKECIEAIGFHRWKYVKDTHLHCMAFRKTRRMEDYLMLAESHPMLFIPQDSHEPDSTVDTDISKSALCQQDTTETLQELPFNET